MTRPLTRPDVTQLIRAAVDKKGGADKFARSLDITPEHVGCLLKGAKPGPRVMRALGVIETASGWVRV